MEHAHLDVDGDGFFDQTTLLVQFGSFRPLLHLFTNTCNVNNEILVDEFLRNFESARHDAHLDRSSCDARITLRIVLLNVDGGVFYFAGGVNVGALVQLLRLSRVPLIFDLTRQFATNELLFLWGDLLGQLQRSKPIL